MFDSKTIFALASGAGRAGVAVFRLSGSQASHAVATLSGRDLPQPRRAVRVRLHDRQGEEIDDGLVLWFPAPASFTGEDVAEFHLHGGRSVAQALTDALLDMGLRPAEPGEFSKRAFLNGKMDLTRAEAIADLVDAETAAQRRLALRQLDGGLARLVDGWRERLIQILALMEATIDFSDEDLPEGLMADVSGQVASLISDMSTALGDGRASERLREGIHIAIVGAPNAGKSSVLNRIAGREAAIVSSLAGTTRDIIEVHLDLHGWPVIVADTAGLREAAEDIEAEGIRRALQKAESADLKLAVFDAAMAPHWDQQTVNLIDENCVVVFNKSDKADCAVLPRDVKGCPATVISARDGTGMDELLSVIERNVSRRFTVPVSAGLTRARHRTAVEEALTCLRRFDAKNEAELATEDLRAATTAIARITGRVDVDDVLDVVFSTFCIGK